MYVKIILHKNIWYFYNCILHLTLWFAENLKIKIKYLKLIVGLYLCIESNVNNFANIYDKTRDDVCNFSRSVHMENTSDSQKIGIAQNIFLHLKQKFEMQIKK